MRPKSLSLLDKPNSLKNWCPGPELNRHGFPRAILSRLRLPFRHQGMLGITTLYGLGYLLPNVGLLVSKSLTILFEDSCPERVIVDTRGFKSVASTGSATGATEPLFYAKFRRPPTNGLTHATPWVFPERPGEYKQTDLHPATADRLPIRDVFVFGVLAMYNAGGRLTEGNGFWRFWIMPSAKPGSC